MKRAERPLCPLRRTKDAVFGVTCFIAEPSEAARRIFPDVAWPPCKGSDVYQLGKKENTGTGDQTDVHCHEPVSREKRFRGRI